VRLLSAGVIRPFTKAGLRWFVRFCVGFRMTADRDDAAGTGAVVRKPPKNEPAMGERALCRTL
jgi:hypothetical protein